MRTVFVVLVLVAALSGSVIAQGLLVPPGAPAPTMKTLAQLEARTVISGLPCELDTPGSYYLTKSLVGISGTNGITITANSVTIDLNGFSLVGVPGSLAGIAVPDRVMNIRISNGVIANWGADGIEASQVYNSMFEGLFLYTNTAHGLYGGTGCMVRDCVASGNSTYGFSAQGNAIYDGCIAANNGSDGIHGGSSVSIANCVSQRNGQYGIYVFSCGVIDNCNCYDNDADGFYVGDGCILNSVSVNNASNGYALGVSVVAENCSAKDNDGHGFLAYYEAILRGCFARANNLDGFNINRTSIIDCQAAYNDAHGIMAEDRCRVVGNSCNNNGWSGEGWGVLISGDNNRVEDNSVVDNDKGLVIDGRDNLVINNSASDNSNGSSNYVFGSGNALGTLVDMTASGNITTAQAWVNFEY